MAVWLSRLALALFLSLFIGWIAFYLLVIRPAMNAWLAQYIHSYPAILHFIPLLGLPFVLIWLASQFFPSLRRAPDA
jgi:hypothetical protein